MKLLRWDAIRAQIGLSRSIVWRYERRGLFPRRVYITARTVGRLEDEVADCQREANNPQLWAVKIPYPS